jgi:hypothetical protein
MTEQVDTSTAPPLYCANHPHRETSLRCNRCEKAICPECAVQTPIGYRCQECVRTQQKTFDTNVWYDYPVAAGTAGILAFLGSILAARLGFFTLFLAPGAGMVIAEIVRALIRKRRGRRLFLITTIAVALGSLPIMVQYLLYAVLGGLTQGGGGLFGLFPLLWQGYYAVVITTSVYTRLSGIQLRR